LSDELAGAETLQSDVMAEPLYKPEVDAWLDSLIDTDPVFLGRIEDQIDLLRQEPIALVARRRQFRTQDGGFCHAIVFEVRQQAWVLVWVLTPTDEIAVVAIQPTDTL
jgi:hypothetical protein